MTPEIWAKIEGYGDTYRVSNLGRLWSKKTRGVMKHSTKRGQNYVWVRKDNQQKYKKIAELVLTAFHGPPNPGESIHRSGEKDDDALKSLRWGSMETRP